MYRRKGSVIFMNQGNEMYVNNNFNAQQNLNKKSNKKIIIIVGIVIVLIILFFIGRKSKKAFYGTWDCNGIILNIDSKNFDMSSSGLDVKSTYKITSTSKTNTISKYEIEASATKRVINGKEYTEPYTTKFEIDIDEKNKDEMAMINVVSYNIYTCKRK